MRMLSMLSSLLLVAGPCGAAENHAILTQDESGTELVAAQFDESSARCLARLGANRQFVLDLQTDRLWLVDLDGRERAIIDRTSIRDWHEALASFERNQNEMRERLLADRAIPAELRELLAQHDNRHVYVPPQRTWKSRPDADAQSLEALVRLKARLAASAEFVRNLFGRSAERLAPYECIVDAEAAPFSLDQAGDGLPPIRFVLVERQADAAWRTWQEVSLASLATQGFDPQSPEKFDE